MNGPGLDTEPLDRRLLHRLGEVQAVEPGLQIRRRYRPIAEFDQHPLDALLDPSLSVRRLVVLLVGAGPDALVVVEPHLPLETLAVPWRETQVAFGTVPPTGQGEHH